MKTEKILISASALSGGATSLNLIGRTYRGDAARIAGQPTSWSRGGSVEPSRAGGFLKLDLADVRQGTWLKEHQNHG